MKTTMKFVTVTGLATLSAGLLFASAGCGGNSDEVAHSHDAPEVMAAASEGSEASAEVTDAVQNQQHCPIMTGMPVNRDLYADHNGKRVYFCCEGCIAIFEADPEKHMEKLYELHDNSEASVPENDAAHDHSQHQH